MVSDQTCLICSLVTMEVHGEERKCTFYDLIVLCIVITNYVPVNRGMKVTLGKSIFLQNGSVSFCIHSFTSWTYYMDLDLWEKKILLYYYTTNASFCNEKHPSSLARRNTEAEVIICFVSPKMAYLVLQRVMENTLICYCTNSTEKEQ